LNGHYILSPCHYQRRWLTLDRFEEGSLSGWALNGSNSQKPVKAHGSRFLSGFKMEAQNHHAPFLTYFMAEQSKLDSPWLFFPRTQQRELEVRSLILDAVGAQTRSPLLNSCVHPPAACLLLANGFPLAPLHRPALGQMVLTCLA